MKVLPALAGALAFAIVPQTATARSYPWPPHWWLKQAMCVHQGEGSWSANTGNGYYGGLQMDLGFQQTYGRWHFRHYGTADHWPVKAQMRAAYEAWKSRSWTPWPQTARACGLL